MIDPPDRLVQDFVEGTNDVDPLGGGNWGDDRAGITDIVHGGPPDLYRQFFRVLAANAKVTLYLNDRPARWIVKVSSIATNGASVYPYEDSYGDPLLIDAGAMAILPGLSPHLTIVANSVGATVSVQAERGHPYVWQGT